MINPFSQDETVFAVSQTTSPLMKSQLAVDIQDLLASYKLVHTFKNESDEPMEAIFTFPIPLDASFTGMTAKIGDEVKTAQIQAKSQAQEQYDKAIGAGNSAVLIEQLELGLLCVSLGNLLPNEEGIIELSFVSLIPVFQQQARFSLPLVHRPRYGRYRMPDYAVPESDFAVVHPLSAEIHVQGVLLNSEVQCSLHAASFLREADKMRLTLDRAVLDRDLVINFFFHENLKPSQLGIPDGDRQLFITTVLTHQTEKPNKVVNLSLLMDCSGSMNGDAIRQSRDAIKAIVSELNDNDKIQIIRFGSESISLFKRPMPVSERVRNTIRELIPTVKANLGGTELNDALNTSLDQLIAVPENNRVIVLVTDGAVHAEEIKEASDRASELGVRIFIVAVGSSAGVDVLEPLAVKSKGYLERATPTESIADVVLRHFNRARSEHITDIKVDFGEGAEVLPLPATYPGDSLVSIAWLPNDSALKTFLIKQGDRLLASGNLTVAEAKPAALAWAGSQLYKHTKEDEKQEVALRYQLLTDKTSAVLTLERDEQSKPDSLPRMVRVKQMQPVICEQYVEYDYPVFQRKSDTGTSAEFNISDIPAFLRRQTDDDSKAPNATPTDLSAWGSSAQGKGFFARIRRVLKKLLTWFWRLFSKGKE